MQRLHLHIGVPELDGAVAFYSALFDAPPSIRKDDYAKWMLDDPRVNLAISTRAQGGIDHAGIQVDSAEDLAALASRLKSAGATTLDQKAASCCYARSDKSWVTDTAGVRWETFFTHGEETRYGEDRVPHEAVASQHREAAAPVAACCG